MIPFKETYYDETEAACVRDALGGADYLTRVRRRLEEIYGGRVFLTSSGSAAFELLLCALGLKAGEVVMPSFTFPSAASAALRAGLSPVFADIDADTKTLCVADAAARMTDRTCCIIPTHYGGVSADMDALRARVGEALIVEDAALSFGARYRGKPLGAIGDFGVLSFHRTKNVSADEGGALIVGSRQAGLADRIQTIFDNGTDRADFLMGRVRGYTWRAPGMNVAMPGVCAAVLYAQLQKADEIKEKQRAVCECYLSRLAPLARRYGFALPHVPAYNDDNFHVFYLVFDSLQTREAVRAHLSAAGIGAAFHYMPLHASAMGARLGYAPGDLPVTQRVSDGLLRLPVYAGMTPEDCGAVAAAVAEALCRK